LKSTDLRCCAANSAAQHMKLYASQQSSCVPSISVLLNSPEKSSHKLCIKQELWLKYGEDIGVIYNATNN
jgi:hypothetical protein